MSEQQQQTQQTQLSPQWQTFVELVQRASAQTGMQAVVLAAAVPAPGGFGPSHANAMAWVIGDAPADWRQNMSPVLGQLATKAAESLAQMPVPANPAAPEATQPEATA